MGKDGGGEGGEVGCPHHQSISLAHSWHYIKVKLKAALEGSCIWEIVQQGSLANGESYVKVFNVVQWHFSGSFKGEKVNNVKVLLLFFF